MLCTSTVIFKIAFMVWNNVFIELLIGWRNFINSSVVWRLFCMRSKLEVLEGFNLMGEYIH